MTLLFLFIGIIAGLRAVTPLAAVCWAAYLGWIHLEGTSLAFLGHPITAWIATAAALGELVTDKWPTTPSRKIPMQFGARLVIGALCGAALSWSGGSLMAGLLAGAIGAVVGTLGGAEFRARLAKIIGKDRPAALIEDAIAIGGAFLIVSNFK